MSAETSRSTEAPRPRENRGGDVRRVAARVAAWFGTAGETDPTAHPEAVDRSPRRRDVVNPGATRIGYPTDPADDLEERLRTLHAERDAAMRGNETRRLRLDAARITHAVCNSLDLTTWERDRVLGVVSELDPSDFEDRWAIPRVALVVARRVVDAERRTRVAPEDEDRWSERPEDSPEGLHLLAESEVYDRLLGEWNLRPSSAHRLLRELEDHLDDDVVEGAVFGRSPYRDPALPPFEHRTRGPPDATERGSE